MSNLNTKPYPKKQQGISNAKSGSLKKPTLAAASTSKSGQSATVASEMVTMPADLTKNATSEMVTMPAGQANAQPRLQLVQGRREKLPQPVLKRSSPLRRGEAPETFSAPPQQRRIQPISRLAKKGRVGQQRHTQLATVIKSACSGQEAALTRSSHTDRKEIAGPTGRSFAQIAKERVLIGVLDRGNPDGRIPRSQWKVVSGNVKVIACDDNRSADLYKAAVATVGEVYQGAKLAAVDWEEIPVRPRARMWFPSTIKEPEQLLKMLQRCNPSLPTHDWRVAKIEESPGPTHQAVIILNKESLAPIDPAGGELNFGFSSVFIRVYKSDAAVSGAPSDKPVVEDIAAELEAPERPEMDRYTSDASSLTRDLRKLWQAGDLEVTSDIASDDEDANVTAASAALLLRLAGGEADIALIQEPWMVCGKVSGLGSADYKLFVANAQEFTLIAFLDIEGAFNNVFPQAITEALTDLGIESRLVGLINQLLTSRAVTSTLGSSTLTREEWAFEPPGKPGALSFYTDCSKLNNQAEILTINEALITLKNSYATSSTINIYSDSQAAIKSIAATTTKSLSVSKCRKSLHEMAEHFDICLIWVPGHQDIPGNCIADDDVDRLLTTRLVPFFSGHLARIAKGSYYSTELAVDRPAMRSWQCMISVSAECRNNVATASGCEPSWC
ncbi:hypothetical protein ACLKA6_008711 [Drosophila palustris]